jgi:CheY-like chemotaxis protein
VVANLLNNSAKYTADQGRIWLTARRDGDEIVLSVKDTGIGIPADMLASIFELFTQMDRSLDRSQGGLGIGLTLVKRIVAMHGGTVQATSAGVGMGTEFTVSLPAAGGDAPTGQTANAAAASASAGLKVLVVDDNIDAVTSLAALLGLSGHRVVSAHSGPDALRLAAEDPPDTVLLDLGLPGMDGFEVARRMRKMPVLASTRLVAMTGYGQQEDRRATEEAGFDAHLVKPVEYSALLKAIEH